MRRVLWILPLAAVFLNPALACGPAEPAYEYGAPEMRAAVAGTWSLSFTPDGGQPTNVTITVEQAASAPGGATTAAAPRAGLVRAAHACGARTLVRGAAACIDLTVMPLEVKFVSGDASLATAALSGTFTVYGMQFASGNLELVLGPYHVAAVLSPFGTIANARLSAPGPGGSLTVVTRQP
jgi:hypothetical protein